MILEPFEMLHALGQIEGVRCVVWHPIENELIVSGVDGPLSIARGGSLESCIETAWLSLRRQSENRFVMLTESSSKDVEHGSQ